MSETEEEIWNRAEALRWAWETLAENRGEAWDPVQQLRDLRRSRVGETDDQARVRRGSIEAREILLQKDLLARIYSGELQAFGRDITSRLDGPIIRIPSGLMNDADPGLRVDWENSAIFVHDRRIIEVRVQQNKIKAVTGSSAKVDLKVSKPAPKKPEAHRPNFRDEFKQKVREIKVRSPSFFYEGNRFDQARQVKAELYGEQARNRDDMSGCKVETAARWIGEVMNEGPPA